MAIIKEEEKNSVHCKEMEEEKTELHMSFRLFLFESTPRACARGAVYSLAVLAINSSEMLFIGAFVDAAMTLSSPRGSCNIIMQARATHTIRERNKKQRKYIAQFNSSDVEKNASDDQCRRRWF